MRVRPSRLRLPKIIGALLIMTIVAPPVRGMQPSSYASQPSPALAPLAVVEAQLAALKAGNVQRCFAFASPNNKRNTGPWQRFEMMVRQTPAYAPLVSCSSFEVVSGLAVGTGRWRCRVKVRPAGSSSAPFAVVEPVLFYDWCLSLQDEEPCSGCWMVDSVMPDRGVIES